MLHGLVASFLPRLGLVVIEAMMALIAVAIIGVGNQVYQDARDRSLERESIRAELRCRQSLESGPNQLNRDDAGYDVASARCSAFRHTRH
jgi:hypothetical protein